MGRRFIRMAVCLMRKEESYIPPELRVDPNIEELKNYYQELWPKLLRKWVEVGAHKVAFAPENPLGRWRKRIEETYKIELKIPNL